MTNINLYQDSSQQSDEKQSFVNSGFFISLSVLVLVLLVLGGMKIYSGSLAKKNQAIVAEIASGKNQIATGQSVNKIVDFQRRLDDTKYNLAENKDVKLVLQNVAKDMIPQVNLASYTYKEGKISMVLETEGFQSVAKQILNFKKSANFTGVSSSDIARGEKNIGFKIEMQVK